MCVCECVRACVRAPARVCVCVFVFVLCAYIMYVPVISIRDHQFVKRSRGCNLRPVDGLKDETNHFFSNGRVRL